MVLSSRHFGDTAHSPAPPQQNRRAAATVRRFCIWDQCSGERQWLENLNLRQYRTILSGRYGERGAAAAKQKAQRILCAAKVSAAGGGYSEPKQGQRSQSARGFCPRSTMRVPQPDILEHFCNADGAPQPLERCLSRQAEIVRCCLDCFAYQALARAVPRALQASVASPSGAPLAITGSATSRAPAA